MVIKQDRFLLNISPRDYQTEIVEKCKDKNTLVVLPTGIGKTLVALMLVIDRMQKFPLEKILFLAPTRPLAEQHLEYFKKHLPELFAQMELFTGKVNAGDRKKIWQRTDIIFSTPQCIANDIKNKLYELDNVSLLIEDEAHRCMKNYSYTYVAKKYHEQAANPLILGLTASPGADKKTIKTICENLMIEGVEIRTRESNDVKEYIQELKFKTILVEFPEKFNEIKINLNKIFERKVNELKNRKVLFGPANKITIINTQNKLMQAISRGTKNFNLFSAASACAQALKVQHAIELIETQTLYSLEAYFKSLFEQANKNQSKAVKNLVSQPEFNKAYTLTQELIAQKLEHPKLLQLKDIIEQKMKSENKNTNKKVKIIVFTQYRDTATRISKELNSANIPSRVFVGQTKKGEGDKQSGLNQKEQQEVIKDFSSGAFNVLCATSIGEEGLDIPEVNAVIFYEPVPSAIRKIQRAGRTARLMPGEAIMLVTKGTRDESYYWSAYHKEKSMYKALDTIKKDLENGTFITNEDSKEGETIIPKESEIITKEELNKEQKTLF
jgi:Fanconi anemia group M protein